MMFVNLLENSYGQEERYYTYRLYSGKSVDDIKLDIINHTKDEWGDYIDEFERDLDIISGKPLNDLVSGINDLVQDYMDKDYSGLTDYDLLVEGPYNDISGAFDFYRDYLELVENVEDYEEPYFYFYGDYAIKVQNLFPYIYNIIKEYGVSVDSGAFDRMSKVLL